MNDTFDLQKEIERYTARITREIFSAKQRERVKEEYAEHMLDLISEYQLGGMRQEEAFRKARAEFGDEGRLQALLAVVHNKDKMPSWAKRLLWGAFVAVAVASWYIVDNDTYRAWLSLLFAVALFAVAVWAVLLMIDLIRGFFIRAKAYKRLKKYVNENGLSMIENASIFRSLFCKTSTPELVIDTEDTRYIINVFATLRRKKTLHLWENGLYLYSDNVGYYVMFTNRGGLFFNNWWTFLPKGLQYLPLYHSDMVELPRGLHMIPKIEWAKFERADKENVRVLMLNPIPFCVKNNKGDKLGDGEAFINMQIYSASGLVSHLEGLRISGNRKKAHDFGK